MARIDVPKVKGKMGERGYNNTSMAAILHINRNTFADYLKNPEKMPYSVVSTLAKVLCETNEEARSIFFAPDLRET